MQDTLAVRAYPLWLAWANRPRRAIAAASIVSLAVVGASLALDGTAELGWRAATRHTAQVSFPLFLIAFLASSIARLWPGPLTRALLARRRALGLAFATAHLVHGASILMLARLDDLVFAPRFAPLCRGVRLRPRDRDGSDFERRSAAAARRAQHGARFTASDRSSCSESLLSPTRAVSRTSRPTGRPTGRRSPF